MKKSPPAPTQYFRHTQSPAWGTAVLVQERADQRTYLFTDGTARTFKTALATRFIEPTDAPSAEDCVRLERGLTSAAAQGPTAALTRVGTATPKAVNLELEAQIRDARGEVGTFLVYADWLQAKSDPRGELIIAQHQLSLDPDNKKLRAAQAQLLAAHDAYFLPPSARQMLAARRKGDPDATSTELTWRYGFIDRVRLARKSARQPELEPVLVELLAHPSAQFLRAITLGALGDTNTFSYLKLVSVIAKARPPLLQEVFVGDFTPAQMELAFTKLGNVSPLVSSLADLRRLVLRGSLRFESAIKHARLEHLAITATELPLQTLDRIATATLPALRTLELAAPGLELPTDLLDHILGGTWFPSLERLALDQTIRTPALLEALLRSPLIGRLKELALRDGDLADPAVIQLTQHAARWGHLRVLDLGGNRISTAALATLDGPIIGAQRVERIPLTIDAVLARAPDARSAQAARELANAEDWEALGRDRDRLWGEYEGSASYWVYAELPSLETGCTCPSPKTPCKHALALLLLAAAQHPFADRPVPASFRAGSERPRYRATWE